MPYVRCINNQGYEASLTQGAIYKLLPQDSNHYSLRVVDNEGEDYLYDARRFERITLDPDSMTVRDSITIHLDPVLKGILRAEALAQQKSISAMLREWIDAQLDLPVA
ncbi:MAG: hypothetical protein V9G20_24225 [Candidatus Promineifilaceae bacterium]